MTGTSTSTRGGKRQLTTFDAVCIGVNAIVGSGIYLFPGRLASELGTASILAWFVTGLACLPLAWTYALLGAREDRTGGAFRYVESAFGTVPGFVVGWSAWVTSVTSWAAVAAGVPGYFATFVPAAGDGVAARVTAFVIVAALTALNVIGVKPGARVTDVLTLGKLVPLGVFVVVGLFFVEPARFASAPPHGLAALPALALMTMFAYQGFEVVGIPAGELRDPRRSVPRAVLAALLSTAVLYALVQIVFVGVGARSLAQPLPDAARIFLGAGGATLLGVGGLVSMLGYNAGTALCAPRYLEALAEQRLVPPALAARHARFDTPHLAIIATGGVTCVLGLILDFDRLVDLAVVAVLAQYLMCSAALVRVGKNLRERALGVLSVVVSLAFAAQCELKAALILLAVMVVGAVVATLSHGLARRGRSSTVD
jgi:basic amino acid/polyamine antiporter, APA family